MPSSFRAYLNLWITALYLSSFNNAALDVRQDRIEKLSDSITPRPFEDKRDYFATSILAESINLNFDSEGRVSIPKKFLDHAKINSSVLFVGLGKVFQIWSPKFFEKFKSIAKKKSFINRSALKWDNKFKKEGV